MKKFLKCDPIDYYMGLYFLGGNCCQYINSKRLWFNGLCFTSFKIKFTGLCRMERSALIKFGEYEHLCSLRDKGEIYMNTLPYFREIEDGELRGDPFDSVTEIIRGNKGHIALETGQKIQLTDFVLRIGPDTPENTNLFCMYTMRPKHGAYPINEKNFKFGEYALVFFDSQELINRIGKSLRQLGISAKANIVEYVGNDHVGEMGPFKKLEAFSYQSEWRLVCENGTGNPRTIVIGDLSTICTLVKAKNINKEITFSQ